LFTFADGPEYLHPAVLTARVTAIKLFPTLGQNQRNILRSEPFPSTIHVQFATGKRGYVRIQIVEFDINGIVRQDLKGIFIWLLDEQQQIFKVLGRLEHATCGGELTMAESDIRLFIHIASVVHVISAYMRREKLYPDHEVAFTRKKLLPPINFDLVSQYLLRPQGISSPPVTRHADYIEMVGCLYDPDAVKLCIQRSSRVYQTAESAQLGKTFDRHFVSANQDRSVASQSVRDTTQRPSPLDTIEASLRSVRLAFFAQGRPAALSNVSYSPPQAMQLEQSLIDECSRREGKAHVLQAKIWTHKAGTAFVGLRALHAESSNSQSRAWQVSLTFDKENLSYVDTLLSAARFVFIVSYDNKETLVRSCCNKPPQLRRSGPYAS
jgi:hypothetical protein